MKTGFLFLSKPPGMTSHDVVDVIRRITGEKRVGHAGTLDPFAEGLLIIGVGRAATRRLSEFTTQPKTYQALARLDAVSSTDDLMGELRSVKSKPPSAPEVLQALAKFTGDIFQTPPAYSAIKLGGKKAYQLARAGKIPALKPRRVTVFRLELIGYRYPELEFEAEVSSGTYMRSLARDMGQALGCGGYLVRLRRLAIGAISLKQVVKLSELSQENWHEYLSLVRA